MDVYSIGFTKKSAAEFFGTLKKAGVKRVLDVRLNNSSQLAGFTKRDDLPFFLRELCQAEYLHDPLLAPTQEILDAYRKNKGSWEDFMRSFVDLMRSREIKARLDRSLFAVPTALLCSEPIADHCHRRFVLEYLQAAWGNLSITHL